MRIMVGVGDLVQRIGDGHTGPILDGRVIERSNGTMCGLHHTRGDEERRFLVLVVAPQNRRREVGAGHTLRSNGLLHVEASRARVFQSGIKTDRGVTVGGARGTIT
jgi:hypothetical protein